MNAKQLKDSILQYAMRGKLVEQDPNDESASKLIERIKEEKARLMEQKVIKKEKPLPPITEEEIPYELPSTWEWMRLGDVVQLINGRAYKKEELLTDDTLTPVLRVGNLFTNKTWYYSDIKLPIDKYCEKGDLLYAWSASFGPRIWEGEKSIYHYHIWKIRVFEEMMKEYIYYYLEKDAYEIMRATNGATMAHITKSRMENMLIAIPPLNEQIAIVQIIKELLVKVNRYEEINISVKNLENQFPIQLEKSILQYAMQGKLVGQVDTDEPARLLVERIKAEKERLVKEKIIKKEKALSTISEEEIPFEIPGLWEWVRLGEVVGLISGRDLTPKEYGTDSSGIPYITGASNFNKGSLEIVRWTYEPKVRSLKGDLLITCKGTIGEMAIQDIETAHIARQVMAIRTFGMLKTEYIQLFLNSVVQDIKSSAKSMIPGISREDILERLIPIPPYEEQDRIVKKVELMMSKINLL